MKPFATKITSYLRIAAINYQPICAIRFYVCIVDCEPLVYRERKRLLPSAAYA